MGIERKTQSVKTYSYAINSHPDWRLGTLRLISRPWYLVLIEWCGLMADNARWMYWIKLPNWPKIQWCDKDDGNLYTPREYWGSVGDLICTYITNPLVQWVWTHPRNTIIEIELGYDRVKALFYNESPDLFDGIWGDDINGERDKEDDESSNSRGGNSNNKVSTLA